MEQSAARLVSEAFCRVQAKFVCVFVQKIYTCLAAYVCDGCCFFCCQKHGPEYLINIHLLDRCHEDTNRPRWNYNKHNNASIVAKDNLQHTLVLFSVDLAD